MLNSTQHAEYSRGRKSIHCVDGMRLVTRKRSLFLMGSWSENIQREKCSFRFLTVVQFVIVVLRQLIMSEGTTYMQVPCLGTLKRK